MAFFLLFGAGLPETAPNADAVTVHVSIEPAGALAEDNVDLAAAGANAADPVLIWRDPSRTLLAWADETGRFHLPPTAEHGKATHPGPGESQAETLHAFQSLLSLLPGMPDHDPFDPQPLRDLRDELRNVTFLLETSGSFSTPPTQPEANRPVFCISDDDSMDSFLLRRSRDRARTYSETFPGGFFTRLFPVLASRSVPGALLYSGRYVWDSRGELTPSGLVHRALVQEYDWEMVNHSTNHIILGYSKDVSDFDEAHALKLHTVPGNRIYNRETETNYEWDSDAGIWRSLAPEEIDLFLLRLKPGGNPLDSSDWVLFADNPQYDYEGQYRFNQTEAERLGLGPVICGTGWAGRISRRLADYIRKTHVHMFSGWFGNNSAGNNREINTPHCAIVRRQSLELGLPGFWGSGINWPPTTTAYWSRNGPGSTPFNTGVPIMETWKMFIESCIENNSSAYFMVHAYQTVWENFNPDAPAPVSMAESGLSWQEILENGDYPEEWCRPVNHPDDDPDTFMLPRPETGLDGDWSHWHPMPGTRLHALWEWIGWMQQQDLAFATPGRNYKWNGNIIETGYFMPLTQAGQARKRPWDSDDFDHFVIGIDGSIRYFKE